MIVTDFYKIRRAGCGQSGVFGKETPAAPEAPQHQRAVERAGPFGNVRGRWGAPGRASPHGPAAPLTWRSPLSPLIGCLPPRPRLLIGWLRRPPARYWSPPGTWRGARSGSLSPLLYSPPAPIGGRAGVPGPPIGCSAGRVPGLVGGCAAPRPAGGRAARLGWRVAGAARQRGAAGAESRAPAAAGWGARSGAWPRRAEPSRAQSGAASSMPPAAERGEPGGTSALAAAGSA